ncbi:hypothetical protein KAV79_04410 [Candidatus Aerophobetes bacterium]|nr:hypothetical protein [Candidatus Aerophobetes bacterium]
MKVKELLARREQLKDQKLLILKSIKEETAKMEKVDLAEFIETGDSGKINGFELDKLQRKRKHLSLLSDSLDQAIVQEEGKVREKRISLLQRKAEDCVKARSRLNEKMKHLLYKVQGMQNQCK